MNASTATTEIQNAANPEVATEKTYPLLGLLLVALSAAGTYGSLYLALS